MTEKNTKFCPNCGAEIDAKAEICPKCGVRIRMRPYELKSPGVAAVLSALYVGLGQIYNGQILKGVLFMIFGFFFLVSTIVGIGFILYPILWIGSMLDAYFTARKINIERGYYL